MTRLEQLLMLLALTAVLALIGLDHAPRLLDGFALWSSVAQEFVVASGEDMFTCRVTTCGPGEIDVAVSGQIVAARHGANGWRFDGQPGADVFVEDGVATVFGNPTYVLRRVDPLDVEAGSGGSSDLIEAPMPGLVRQVFVCAGATVAKGDRLAILEAMKMENSLLAARDGVVAEVMAEAGSQVEAGAVLIRLEEEES